MRVLVMDAREADRLVATTVARELGREVLDTVDGESELAAAASLGYAVLLTADAVNDAANLFRRLQAAVRTDSLTGLFNRRRLEEDTPILDDGLRRYDRPFAVAIADVDHFKSYNDQYGHPAGDHVLRLVSSTFRRSIRQGDVVYRYGGEEFVFVFPAQGLVSARVAAERARAAIESLAIAQAGAPTGVVTVSIGIADATDAGGLRGAIEQADAALYDAKSRGRNRVVLAQPAIPARIRLP